MSRIILFCCVLLAFACPIFAQNADPRALIEAVEQNDPKAVQSQLRAGADVNMTVASTSPFYLFFLSREMYLNGLSKQMTHEAVFVGAIHANAARANEKILKLLLKKRANIDAGDSEGKTPLMYALRSPGGEAYALLLIRKGANYTTRDNASNTAMHYAAFGGNLQGVQMTLTGGTDINARNHQGITPLHAAAVRAEVDMMQAMIDLGADINAIDSLGFSVLHYAAGYASVDKLKWILGLAPQLQDPQEDGPTPMDIARLAGNDPAVEFLRSKGGFYNDYRHQELIDALLRRDFDAVRSVLADGANPNRSIQNRGKSYPLHVAAQNGDNISTDLLLKAGADPERLDQKGRNALDIALENALPQTALILLQQGAKAQPGHLGLALTEMSTRESPGSWEDVVLKMIQLGLPLDQPVGKLNMPPLHYAAYLGHEGIVNALLAAGASASQTDPQGWTPLHWAVMKRDLLPRHPEKVAIARLLLGKGCPIQASATQAKELPHTQPYMAKRVPAHVSATDLLQYALPKDLEMSALLAEQGGKALLSAADYADNGLYFYQAKDYTTAMTELNKALQVDPRNAEALYLRGSCKQQLSLLEEAERDFNAAIAQASTKAEYYLARGKVRHDLNKAALAVEDFDFALKAGLKRPETLYWRGKGNLKLGKRSAACEDLKASADLGYVTAETALKLYCQ